MYLEEEYFILSVLVSETRGKAIIAVPMHLLALQRYCSSVAIRLFFILATYAWIPVIADGLAQTHHE